MDVQRYELEDSAHSIIDIIDMCEEVSMINREFPLGTLLNRVFAPMSEGEEKDEKSILAKAAIEHFRNTHRFVPQSGGNWRIMIKVTRLPDYLYPDKVDGTSITKVAINRYFRLQNRLHHARNAKLYREVSKRITDLIDTKIMVPVGKWDDEKAKLYAIHQKDKESIQLPWQTVINKEKSTDTGKVRMCLDGSATNKLLYKVE